MRAGWGERSKNRLLSEALVPWAFPPTRGKAATSPAAGGGSSFDASAGKKQHVFAGPTFSVESPASP
jgi:hypothetical protein